MLKKEIYSKFWLVIAYRKGLIDIKKGLIGIKLINIDI